MDYFYSSLRELVTLGKLPDGHPLLSCPLDPDTSGQDLAERRAVAKLNLLATPRWARALRCLYYGYVSSGYRLSSLHIGICYSSMYDEEMQQLLRSHEGDETLFPRVFLPDLEAEARFMEKIRRIDREMATQKRAG